MSNLKFEPTNILVVGGVHGNETSGIELVKKIKKYPINGFTTLLANPDAVKKKVRYIETDLNRSFGKLPISLEEKLATKICKKTKKFDLVLDFHNTDSNFSTCAILTCKPSNIHYFLASYFGLDKIVIMSPGGSLCGQASQKAFAIEISESDKSIFSTDYFYQKLLNMPNNVAISQNKKSLVLKHVANVNYQTYNRTKKELGEIIDFKSLNNKQKQLLGLQHHLNYYPLFYKYSAGKLSNTCFLILTDYI